MTCRVHHWEASQVEPESVWEVGMVEETPEDKWTRCYSKFQNFRNRHSLSISHVFDLINDSGTTMLCLRAFCNNLVKLISTVSVDEAAAWTKELQKISVKRDFISAKDVSNFCHIYKKSTVRNRFGIVSPKEDTRVSATWHERNSQFPLWLSEREDFQKHFVERNGAEACPTAAQVIQVASIQGNRRPSELAVLLRWMLHHKILPHATQPKLLDLCRKLTLLCVPSETDVVVQGGPGDAFYLIITGQLSVAVDNKCVDFLREGQWFGERALENDAPRAATVTTTTETHLLVIRASDYKSVTLSARALLNVELMKFTSTNCPAFKKLSYPSLYTVARKMNIIHFQTQQPIFQQAEVVKGLYIVLKGQVHISRRVTPITIMKSNFLPSMINMDAPAFNIIVDEALLGPGAIFGDECVRERKCHNNSAVAAEATQLIFINSSDVGLLESSTIQSVIQETAPLHEEDLTLVLSHEIQLKKKMVLRTFKKAALKPVMINRLRVTSRRSGDSTEIATESTHRRRSSAMFHDTSVVNSGASESQVTTDRSGPRKSFLKYPAT